MRIFRSLAEMEPLVGQEVAVSDWIDVTQERIRLFAEATNDHQWIHLDAERAKAGPFGTTIAHGFLTLSLLPALIAQVYRVDGVKMGINYGLNKVRFTSPVPVGSKVRGTIELTEVGDVAGGVQLVNKVTVEIEGSERPALVAEWLTRQYV